MKLLKGCKKIRAGLKLLYSELKVFLTHSLNTSHFKIIIPSSKKGSGCRNKIYVGVCKWGAK